MFRKKIKKRLEQLKKIVSPAKSDVEKLAEHQTEIQKINKHIKKEH